MEARRQLACNLTNCGEFKATTREDKRMPTRAGDTNNTTGIVKCLPSSSFPVVSTVQKKIHKKLGFTKHNCLLE